MPFEGEPAVVREEIAEHFETGVHLPAGTRWPFHEEDRPSCCPT
jgi:hypothetical protein